MCSFIKQFIPFVFLYMKHTTQVYLKLVLNSKYIFLVSLYLFFIFIGCIRRIYASDGKGMWKLLYSQKSRQKSLNHSQIFSSEPCHIDFKTRYSIEHLYFLSYFILMVFLFLFSNAVSFVSRLIAIWLIIFRSMMPFSWWARNLAPLLSKKL